MVVYAASVAAVRSPVVTFRRLAITGAAVAITGLILRIGPSMTMLGVDIPLPFALVIHSPLRFFRYPSLFFVIMNFGLALMVAAALADLRLRSRRWLTAVVFVA